MVAQSCLGKISVLYIRCVNNYHFLCFLIYLPPLYCACTSTLLGDWVPKLFVEPLGTDPCSVPPSFSFHFKSFAFFFSCEQGHLVAQTQKKQLDLI